uniref:MATH domain-containing protein n=1 Tax=Kalanchoe fedtschenkoi TaxID=63787 RepID=A0A7N0USR0_KALFE
MASVELERVEFRTNVSGQYTFAIKSFSDLSEILSGRAYSYESPEFEFGGHKWKLSLYPNGDTQCGGGGHISLYLNMVDATGSYGSGIGVTYKMLDPQSGYLVDDCCLFGIELMMVVSREIQLGCLSIVKKPADGTFKWTLDKFSTLKEPYYDTDPFTVEAQQWKLRVYPNGNSSKKGSCLSLLLHAHDVMYHRGSKVYVDAIVRLKDHLCRRDHEISFQQWIGESGGWGCDAFLLLTELKDKARGFLIDDSLVFELSITAISNLTEAKRTLKESPKNKIFKTQAKPITQDMHDEFNSLITDDVRDRKLSLYLNGNRRDDEIGVKNLTMVFFLIMENRTSSGRLKLRIEIPHMSDYQASRVFHIMKVNLVLTRIRIRDPEMGQLDVLHYKINSNNLVDDCCLFGIELMMVVSREIQLGCLSIVKKPADGTFKWTLDKFSTLKEPYYDTDPFTVEAQQWKLRVYPNGNSSKKGSCLSVFLHAHDVMYHRGSKVHVDAIVRLKDNLRRRDHEISFFSPQKCTRLVEKVQFDAFLPLTDLKDKARGLLIDDSLVFELSITAISNLTEAKRTLKESPKNKICFKTQASNFRQLI